MNEFYDLFPSPILTVPFTLLIYMRMQTFAPPPLDLTLLFVISCKRANIFPVFARLDPHLIKLAHYVAL